MKAMLLESTCVINPDSKPLKAATVPVPEPLDDEVLIRICACGVCHTELDEIEGRTAPESFPVIPGHEVVGVIEMCGKNVSPQRLGERVGIGWIHRSSGDSGENLSDRFVATGRDANGGYAEYMTVGADYAFPIPDSFTDAEAAPLLCAGAVGYRSLMLCGLHNGQALGLTGFGGSAHIVLQLAQHLYPDSPVCVFARDESARVFALQLGASWAGATEDASPMPLSAIIDTTPAWRPVVHALSNLAPGGRLVINAIRKEDADKPELLNLNYHDHLWMEKEIKSVANVTAKDIAEFLPLAAEIPIRPEVEIFQLQDANRALRELKFQPVRGAKVLVP